MNVAERHETSTFVRLDSEIQLGDRSGTPTHKGAKQVPGHSITFSHDALNIGTKILVLLRHEITPIHLSLHFAVPTGIQHLHVRLWYVIFMHQSETSIFVVQKGHLTAGLETCRTMLGEW